MSYADEDLKTQVLQNPISASESFSQEIEEVKKTKHVIVIETYEDLENSRQMFRKPGFIFELKNDLDFKGRLF